MPKAAFLLSFALGAALARTASAAETIIMTVGERDGASVTFGFDRAAEPHMITLRTQLAGVAGSKLAIYVDKARIATFTHLFAADECRFRDGDRSQCVIVVTQTDRAYDDIVKIFRLGREARITVEDPGTMALDHVAPLSGFIRSFDG